MTDGQGALVRSHKALSRGVALAVLARLGSLKSEFTIETFKSNGSLDEMMEAARLLMADDTKAPQDFPLPSSSYRPTGWKTSKTIAVA